MELYYKVITIENAQGVSSVTYQKEYKGSEPLFLRRAAIAEAEKIRILLEDATHSNTGAKAADTTNTIVVTLCFSPIDGLVSELPVHYVFGNEELHLLAHHSWPLETSLYFQYQHDTGGDIASYMGVLVLPDVLEQVLEED